MMDAPENATVWFCSQVARGCHGEGWHTLSSKATRDAEWHNTNTGHTVFTEKDGELWVQTDKGWELLDK